MHNEYPLIRNAALHTLQPFALPKKDLAVCTLAMLPINVFFTSEHSTIPPYRRARFTTEKLSTLGVSEISFGSVNSSTTNRTFHFFTSLLSLELTHL